MYLKEYITFIVITCLLESVQCSCFGSGECGWSFSSLWFVWFIIIITMVVCCGAVGAYRRRLYMKRLEEQFGVIPGFGVPSQNQLQSTNMAVMINGGYIGDINHPHNHGLMQTTGFSNQGPSNLPVASISNPPPYSSADTMPPKYEDVVQMPSPAGPTPAAAFQAPDMVASSFSSPSTPNI